MQTISNEKGLKAFVMILEDMRKDILKRSPSAYVNMKVFARLPGKGSTPVGARLPKSKRKVGCYSLAIACNL